MLKIRKEQMHLFEVLARQRFEQRVIANLQQHFPDECGELGEEGLKEAVTAAIDRAEGHGLELEYDVQRFCNLAFVLGPQFDTELEWAAELLADDDLTPAAKVAALCDQAEEELEGTPETGE